MTDEQKIYLAILMEEYKTLRDESKQASINMFTAFRWAGAVVGAVFGAGFLAWYHKLHFVVLIIFFVLVPALSAFSAFLWLGEAIRHKRVGDYICFIEQKAALFLESFAITKEFRETWNKLQCKMEKDLNLTHSIFLTDPLNWEQWLRAERTVHKSFFKSLFKLEGHLALIYILRLLTFPFLMGTSFAIGTYYAMVHPRLTPNFLKNIHVQLPKGAEGSSYLMIFSFILIIVSLFFVVYIALKLFKRQQPTSRERFNEWQDPKHGNAA